MHCIVVSFERRKADVSAQSARCSAKERVFETFRARFATNSAWHCRRKPANARGLAESASEMCGRERIFAEAASALAGGQRDAEGEPARVRRKSSKSNTIYRKLIVHKLLWALMSPNAHLLSEPVVHLLGFAVCQSTGARINYITLLTHKILTKAPLVDHTECCTVSMG